MLSNAGTPTVIDALPVTPDSRQTLRDALITPVTKLGAGAGVVGNGVQVADCVRS